MSQIPPLDVVLFGATGDLVMRKLIPALYHLHQDGMLSAEVRIIGVARSELSSQAYVDRAHAQASTFLGGAYNDGTWQSFAARIQYQAVDATKPETFKALASVIGNTGRACVYYLSTAPNLFTPTCRNLADAGLISADSRVILEKPLGTDLASNKAINDEVGQYFGEKQIFRIDHYLGKEPVQNLLALRFGNVLLEPLWRGQWVRDVQITVAEQLGVEARGEFYEKTGAMRDMVQNHLLQLLCITAMEPPASLEPDSVRDEKLKVLRALKPITGASVGNNTVRGQYRAGAVGGQPVKGYLDEAGIAPDSNTETFVAIKAEIGSWRWAGVPFYLRTGKRMQEKLAEIVINFKPIPHCIFDTCHVGRPVNRLVIQMQPDETVHLHLLAKQPGNTMRLGEVALDMDFSETFKARQLEAYERLLMDAMLGNLTLFVRRDEQEAAWRWVEPILDAWAESGEKPKSYTAGTWGPAASSALLGRNGHAWHEEI
ncbi:glucose-6-phosphate dehydrogenase [Niveibacterium umoris]|uniref:Glucose-6-phosphate 1-dehydrogenase n=1 Tax=Niveibacterium umoris TaxID=1193620 RepID=A0A840BC91_9RHOO|nr:glucose-6-phosphate dehydrogenase [Niveibacterium umoris]MBB4011161.1 glucose-6-phosphate 1-dehydrogenase [Niveibacterium umoris]